MSIKKTRDQVTFELVFTAALIAFIAFFTFFAYIQYGIINVTFVHVVVLIGAIFLGKKGGLILGFAFGLGSMLRSFILLADVPFTNPLLSIVPRMIFGYMSAVIYDFFKTKFKKPILSIGLTMGLGTLFHTVIVVPILIIIIKTGFHFFSAEFDFESIMDFIIAIVTHNMIWEILAAVLLGTPIVMGLNAVLTEHKKIA